MCEVSERWSGRMNGAQFDLPAIIQICLFSNLSLGNKYRKDCTRSSVLGQNIWHEKSSFIILSYVH